VINKEMKPAFVKPRRGKSAFAKGIITANHAKYANTDEINLGAVPLFRVFRVVRGQYLLLDKVEKNRTSPKTWYRAIFRLGKFERAANQNITTKTGRNRSLKFLQFLENFSGGDIYRGGVEVENGECKVQNYEL